MKFLVGLVYIPFVYLFVTNGAIAQEATKETLTKISELAWIAGNWTSDNGGTVTEEQWLEPRAGMMVGMNRMTFPNGKGTFEFLRIAETEKGLTYFASPSGKAATPFPIHRFDKHKVIFQNKANDFPQRIVYEKVDDTLVASIEGDVNGETKSMKWTWKRSPAVR